MQYASANLRHLDEYAARWPDDEGELVRKQDKLVLETVLLLLVADRVGARQNERSWAELVEYCTRWCRAQRVRYVMARHPQTVTSLGAGHLHLSALGYPDAGMDRLVANAVRTGEVGAHGCSPFRRMEQQWIFRQLASGPLGEIFSGLITPWDLDTPFISSDMVGIYSNRDDCYALTHALMYVTDFGQDEIPGITPEDLRSSIGSAACLALAISDFDILGELQLADAVVPGTASGAVQCGWALRTHVLHKQGFLPGPTFRDEDYERQPAAGRDAYRFLHQYHVAYVDALLCATVLARNEEWLSPGENATPAVPSPDALRIVDIAWPSPPHRTPPAVANLLELPIAPAVLLEALTEAATIAIVRRYDLTALTRMVVASKDSRAGDSKGIQVAAQFLSNQASLI
ncbi:DUF6895 family protein [Kitasatospora sp. NPDC008050]|uniref:DUF6895 family protein n=1 Tax=Kitasatospora sp. NPDC008050 TaxID=3364021 RepID=UPI0036E2882D